MKKIIRKISGITLAGLLAVGLLSGCGKVDTVDAQETVMLIGEQEVSLGLANFAVRYQQAMYESYAGITGDSWGTKLEEGNKTQEANLKENILEELQNAYLEQAHMEEYDIALTEEEISAIETAATEFVENNELEAKEVVSGEQEIVVEYLTLMTIQTKMEEAIQEEAEVSDEEAAQKAMQYVEFYYYEDADEETLETDDEEEYPMTEEGMKKAAEKFREGALEAEDFEAYAVEQGLEVQTLTFDAETTEPSEEVIQEADQLDEGEISQVIQGESTYYVVKLTSLLDREATDEKKTELLDEKKTDYLEEKLDEWKEETTIKVYKRVWKQVDLKKQGVSYKQVTETTPGSEDSYEETTETESSEETEDTTQ